MMQMGPAVRGAVRRAVVLFVVGATLALLMELLLQPPASRSGLLSAASWWVPPVCGTAAAVIGLLYPCLDSCLGEPHKLEREWASVLRCVAVFVGINHASAKLEFANPTQLSLTLAALSLGLWWTFDRSRGGLGLGLVCACAATLLTQLLLRCGLAQFSADDLLPVRSWLPCIFFAGGVTVGSIGRQLAMCEGEAKPDHLHAD